MAPCAVDRRCRQASRRQTRSPPVKGRHEVLTPELASLVLDPSASPPLQMERRQRQAVVQAIIEELGESMPELRHRIMVWYWIKELSLATIAAELDVSQNCVWSALRRGAAQTTGSSAARGPDADLGRNSAKFRISRR